MEVSWKVWIKNNDKKVFGRGPKDLLINIDQFGSINKAASEMNMSYSKALRLINTIESELKIEVLERRSGGKGGGGSVLTDDAKALVEKFDRFEKEVEKEIVKAYKKICDI